MTGRLNAIDQLKQFPLPAHTLKNILHDLENCSPEEAWQHISKNIITPEFPFKLQLTLFSLCYPDWHTSPNTAAAWIPDATFIDKTHLAKWMKKLKLHSLKDFHAWTVKNKEQFWQEMIETLSIQLIQKYENIADLSHSETPRWLIGAKMNIVDSCFKADPNHIAIILQKKHGVIKTVSYGELFKLTHRIANSLIAHGFKATDPIAIDMPMNDQAVAIYLAIIKMGGVVISIADSFSKDEIAARLRITKAKAIFTEDFLWRDDKKIPLYEKVVAANAPIAIVLPSDNTLACSLRSEDIAWDHFLGVNDQHETYASDPMMHCNILFSSGTTGDPKAIPWTHTTAIKAATDAYLHHNIEEDDIFAWPTNLGWMMGPWLIFATLINNATMALYLDVPRNREFGKFIQDAKVTFLGVVPTLVAHWRQTQCMEGLNWKKIKLFTSTGECSNPEDMLYLMSLAGFKPVIEYCGGTEIGGAYISSTLIENNYPSVFTTKTFGLDFLLLDEKGRPKDTGEVALIPPSIGLSAELLNGDHHQTYYANMPLSPEGNILRRHGDEAHRFQNGSYLVLGRVDDTMNLGGIKVSSAEIERVLSGIDDITETAAISASLHQQGPSQLIIYAVTQKKINGQEMKKTMQTRINQFLNPLFKIHDVIFINELPKTASNKIMRRSLRMEYQKNHDGL
ncbi:MAG: AMP-dependent synthetase and ligase [uncultured bacterium]|nr:MAG: AMP-dependent synthetase and ligase [uncultured bacterium]